LNTDKTPHSRGKNGKLRKRFLALFGILLLVAIVAGLWPAPLTVETAIVKYGPLTVSVLEEGKTRIRHRYVISPPVNGYLRRVALRAGAPIEEGKTVLAIIQAGPSRFLDPRTRIEAEMREKAAVAVSMQRQAAVERARAVLDLAKKDFIRTDELLKKNTIPVQEWDAAENRVAVLERELNSAEFALRAAEFEVAQARAALEHSVSSESSGDDFFEIVAPVDGYVLNVYEESARVITAGTPIMEIGDTQNLEAEIELLSDDAVAVVPGAEVSIEQWGGDAPLRGKVTLVERGGFTKISALGVEEQRVKVRVDFLEFPPQGKELGDRFRVEARIVTWHGEKILQIPTGALFRLGNDWTTFVVEGGKAHLRRVEIDHNNGIEAEVISGLMPQETVIVYPPDNLADGDSVAK
jgi:HlyD family secretion protein